MAVNWDRPPTNETRASDPLSAHNKNNPLNLWENDEKSFWKTVEGKGTNQRKRRKVVVTSKEPNIQSTERNPKNMAAAVNSLG